MKAVFLPLFLLVCLSQPLSAQLFYGQVTDLKEIPLPGATVVWTGTTIGARTDDQGEFAPNNYIFPRGRNKKLPKIRKST